MAPQLCFLSEIPQARGIEGVGHLRAVLSLCCPRVHFLQCMIQALNRRLA
jgi:hypothetical protein